MFMPAFRYEITQDGIAIVSFDLPDSKVNKLTTAVMMELDALLDELGRTKGIRALVFRSSKPGNFIVGADIAEIRAITDPAAGARLARNGQAVFNKIESLPFPTVAAIHGPCMGGGMELALAFSLRVISNDPKTALAQPEVKLGIMPGFGGTQRLPRLVGLANALDMILTGQSVFPRKAKRIGLVDEVTYPELLLGRAIALARLAADKGLEAARRKRPLLPRLVADNPLSRLFIVRAAKQAVLRETRGNYPAPLAALEATRLSARNGDAGYAFESRMLGELACTEVSKNLISVFYLSEMLKKSAGLQAQPIKNIGVVGAGVMGGGIAQLFAEKERTVRMKDVTTQAVGKGLLEAAVIFGKRGKKGVLSAIQARDGLDRITGTTDYSGFGNADAVVEAVVENIDVKKTIVREFDAVAKPGAIFASNTSSLSITELARDAKHPENVVGMHFFNPVEKMPLVEIVRGARTSESTIEAIAALSRSLGKLPVVVNDGPGFLVNRILMPYLGEAALLFEQGAGVDEIDHALLSFGMPMGAFILLDEIGIDVAHKVSEILHAGLGDRATPPKLLATLYKEGYLGRKNRKGFYQYDGGKRKEPDPHVSSLAGSPGRRTALSAGDIVARTVMLMIKEAALCLEERTIDRPDMLDAALVFGIGFPPFRGGLLRYADRIGIRAVLDKLEQFTRTCGDRYTPPSLIIELAKEGKGFYGSGTQMSADIR
jgi:3-hydroxyacyl-CoA dehydrogenase/enoyl-CoA hydratase/3-hydroxybutyryl-CoA epimerase